LYFALGDLVTCYGTSSWCLHSFCLSLPFLLLFFFGNILSFIVNRRHQIWPACWTWYPLF
jgi:hypothetical protein